MRSLNTLLSLAALAFASLHSAEPTPLRLGIIGLDTSHVIAFTKTYNDPAAPDRQAPVCAEGPRSIKACRRCWRDKTRCSTAAIDSTC